MLNPASRQAGCFHTKEILKRYEKWKDIAMISGLPGLRLMKDFRTKPCRVSGKATVPRASVTMRVIYRVIPERLLFQVASITAHDYRRS